MGFVGITRVRNEAHILKDTLDHVAEFLDGVVLVDDSSTDGTIDIAEEHPVVTHVLRNDRQHVNRPMSETIDRQRALRQVMQSRPDWIMNFDADERFEWPKYDWQKSCDILRMRLFDFYITPEDEQGTYVDRRWIGPEYRDMIIAWRGDISARFQYAIQREPMLRSGFSLRDGWVKHYGKAISVEHWDAKCDYYANNFPKEYSDKWSSRRGKAVHREMLSDFGRPLITWDQKERYGVDLLAVGEQKV